MRILPFYFLFLFADLANAQTQWGNLKPGRYAVGYKTIQTVDYSRKYFDTGRPLQIYMWYPSSDSLSGEPMVYGSYFEDAGKDWGSVSTSEILRRSIEEQFKTGALNPSFPGTISDEQVKAIKQTPIPVRRDANEAESNFPLLIHLHVQGALTQSIMLEYLASHGYVVMSISMLGSSPAYFGRGEGSAKEMLDLTEDLAFVLAEARQQPIADTKNVAVIGMMAQAGLSLQFKATPLRAIACLDCFWSTEVLSTLPFYDPKLARIPILELVNTEFASQKGTYLDSLYYSDRYMGRFKRFPHADFYPFHKIARPALSADFTNYELILGLTLSFLNASVKKETDAIAYLQAISKGEGLPQEVLSVTKTEGKAPIPSEHEFLAWLRYGEMDKARIAWKQHGNSLASQNAMFTATLFLVRDRENQAFEVFEMYISGYPPTPRNQMLFGYLNNFLLEIKDFEKAEKVCLAWTKQFPDSWEAWLNLGRALRDGGKREAAKPAFENVLELVQKSTLPTAQKEQLISEAKGGP